MTARELIALLQREAHPDLPVVMWDKETDDWAEVEDGIYEDGTSQFALSTSKLAKVPVTEADGDEP